MTIAESTDRQGNLAVCATCGNSFVPRRVDQIRCRKECRRRPGHGSKYEPLLERRFVAWDGEAQGDSYTLLQNSDGASLYDPHGIATEEAFEFLTAAPKDVANIWFGVGYDVNMIVRDLSWSHVLELAREGVTYWHGWRIGYIPRKIFRISHKATGRSFSSYDVQTFFASSFIGALDAWSISVPEIIREGKASRNIFDRWGRREIALYNEAECRLLVELAGRLRATIVAAGWRVSGWHGPGALAAWFLGEHRAHEHLQTPRNLRTILERAYFGGRIDAAGWGHADGVYHYDIVSAYPAAMRECPSIDGVPWRTVRAPSQPFALARVRWRVRDGEPWGPFPWRDPAGRILWPNEAEGWYWWVEVEAARRRFGSKMRLRVLDALEPNVSFYPMREPIEKAFEHRRALKAADDPAHVAIKLGLNSLYGKTAQTISYGKRPRFYSLAWAGYLTARARAHVQDAISEAGAYAVMTDAVWTRSPLPASWLGDRLGDWSAEGRGRLDLVTPGVYSFNEHQYTRGFERAAFDDVASIVARFEAGEPKIDFKVRRFVGMRLAAIGGEYAEAFRRWIDIERDVHNPAIFGTSKRMPARSRGVWHPLPNYYAAGLSARYKKVTLDEEVEAERMMGECDE